jgi:hypothetical protein
VKASPVSGEHGLVRFAEQLDQSVVPHAAQALTAPYWLELAVDAETPWSGRLQRRLGAPHRRRPAAR